MQYIVLNNETKMPIIGLGTWRSRAGETYSAIRRGKYKTVSRENAYRLCFGLRLNYDDAIKLMGSCGLAFRGDSVLDAVVEYFLKQGPTKGSVNRLVKKENKPLLEEIFSSRIYILLYNPFFL